MVKNEDGRSIDGCDFWRGEKEEVRTKKEVATSPNPPESHVSPHLVIEPAMASMLTSRVN